jgi:outer membrane protein assembly factor BamD (BamD/ComL family)
MAGHVFAAAIAIASAGCEQDSWNFLRPPPPTVPPPAESLVLRPEGLQPERAPTKNDSEAILVAAREAFRKEEYDTAEDLFYRVADNTKAPPSAIQEAIYYRAECLRMQDKFPKAADVYADLNNKFPQNPYREQSVQHMYDIANYWLEDTRAEMREDLEHREGKRWIVWPRFVSFEKTKPLLDREGRAVETLKQVRLHDISGPLADHALFMAGTVYLYHENYREAEHYFSQIFPRHPDSPLAPKSLELAIFCKHMCTGGPDYDGRKVEEARKLVQTAFNNYPQLTKEKKDWLTDQLNGITLQQAEKDFNTAEFYKRTGHPGSAYWSYELVRRRYPGTKFEGMAADRMNELRSKLKQGEDAKLAKQLPPATKTTVTQPGKDSEKLPAPEPASELLPTPKTSTPGPNSVNK